MTKFAAFLGIAALFFFLSFLFLPTFILSPHKFALLFTSGSICVLVALAFYHGPLKFVKKLFTKEKWMFSAMYICSLILTLWASVIMGSYFLTLIAIIVQAVAMMWFLCTSFPGGQAGMKMFSSLVINAIKKCLGR